MKAPIEWDITVLARNVRNPDVQQRHTSGEWIPARPITMYWSVWQEIRARFRLAWKVFRGEADALVWEQKLKN